MKKTFLILISLYFISIISFAQEREKQSFNGIQIIKLNTASGDCDIIKGKGNSVEVLVEYTYDPEDYEVKMEQNGGRLDLEEKFHARNMSGSSSWTLTVPDGLKIDFNTGSGNLEFSDLKGEYEFNSGSGDLEASDFEGELDLNTGSGDYILTNIRGEIDANTGSGEYRIRNCDIEIKANTGSGDFEVEKSKGEFRLNSGSGDLEIEDLILTEEARFNTGSGDVEVSLGAALEHDIRLNSGSGNTTLDFNGKIIEGNITMKAKKRGGDIRAPFEFDSVEEVEEHGDIYIVKKKKLGNKNVDIYIGTGTGTAEIKE